MNDSMQFGPEWLRNLSQHDEENTMAIPKYQLAEHRYGREEMLALFDRSVLAPEPLRSIGGLYVEKLQSPLALIQMSEEETRVWNSNMNNDTSQRNVIKGASNQMPNVSQTGNGMGMSRGRGTSVDRGKGRTSRGPYHYNNRNYADEGTDLSHSGAAFGRPRMFERSQSHNNERNWSERNGNVDCSDWNGYGGSNVENGLSTSPRKDFGTSNRLTSSREDTNWRRRPTNKDEDDGWRSNKHSRTGYNWREGGERDREKEKDIDGQEVSKDRRWITRISNMHSQPNRYSSEMKDDSLPEWATESLGEGGGTFDSSGAFHGSAHSDDDDFMEGSSRSLERVEKREKKVRDRDSREMDCQELTNRSERKPPITEQPNEVNEKSTALPEGTLSRHNPEFAPRPTANEVDTCAIPTSPPKNIVSKQSASQHLLKGSSTEDCYGREADIQDGSKEKTKLELDNKTYSQPPHPLLREAYSQLQSKKMEYISGNSNNPRNGAYDAGFNFGAVDNSLIMNPTIVQNFGGSSNQMMSLSNKLLSSPSAVIDNNISVMNAKDNIEKSKSTPVVNAIIGLNSFTNRGKSKDEDLDCIVGDVVSKFMAEEEEKEKLKKLDGMNKWYYRDPQGQVQGPFPNNEMAEWYKLGYFHDKSLIVRRACESSYYPLHDLVTFLNGSPFETVTLQNFTKYSRVTLPGIQLNQTSDPIQSSQLPSNMSDESSLLLSQAQHYQTPFDMLYARQQQILAARKKQLSQPQEEMKTLFEQQKLISQHMNSTIDAGVGVVPPPTPTNTSQSTIPIMPGYMHPILPSAVPPQADPNLVMILNQMQHQQHLHLIQQQLQQQQQHHHHHQQQQQQMSHQQLNNDIKLDRLQQQQPQQQSSQPNLMSHLEHPLQQLVHKMNTSNLPSPSQISMIQAQCGPSLHSVIPTITSDVLQSEESAAFNSEKVQTTNAIQNLLKQLGVPAEKQSKPVDSIWGSANVSTAAPSNNSSFNAQHWCSQVGKLGPTNVAPVANSGPVRLWMQDNVPPTAAMKTEQEIIESFMKSMRPQEELIKEAENKADLLKKEEQLKVLEETKKKEEKKAKLEEEKRKQLKEEEKLRKIEEEQRRKALEDAKRKEEERKRKEEEKRKHEEEKEEKRKAEEEKKKRNNEPLQDLKDMQRKQAEAMKRLKEQQQLAGSSKPSLKSVTAITLGVADQVSSTMQTVPKVPKANTGNQLSKSQSGEISSDKKVVKVGSHEPQLCEQQATTNKQIGKSKSTSSVPTPNQKVTMTSTDTDKKAPEKKKKDKNPTNAWADQKKIPQVKSLAEIQAEEQKKLAKQIEKEKQDRLLQQQQATASALAAKEAINFNMWKSQSQPWKNSWTSTSCSPSPISVNYNDSTSSINRQSTASNILSSVANRGGGGKNLAANNASVASGKVPSDKNAETSNNVVNVRNKGKKEDAVNKKSTSSSSSSSSAAQSNLKNDELSKWGIKALSGLKVSVDVPTFIGFLRDVESPNDVMEYVSDYLGDGKETKNFVKQFLEKRSASGFGTVADDNAMMSVGNAKKSKNKKTAGSEESTSSTSKVKDYYCSKEPVSKTNSAEFVEVKGKSKKSTKKKVLRVDPTLLGFNVTAAPDRINIGERDFGEDVY